jgi:LysM repeat protein
MNTIISHFQSIKNAFFLSIFQSRGPLSIIAFLTLSTVVFGQNMTSYSGKCVFTASDVASVVTPKSVVQIGDSTKYLTPKDTIFISLDTRTGEKVFDHKIAPKQNLYRLARFYGMNEEELFPYNPSLKSNVVGIGQIVKVPIPNPAIRRFKGDNFKRWKYAPIVIIVQKGDNLFNIAKRMFRMPVDSVMKWNNMPNQNVVVGQRLQVGWLSIDGVPDSLRSMRKVGAAEIRSKMLSAYYTKQKAAKEESGAAFWQLKGNPKTDLYCLHRTAKAGSIVAIQNTMNQKVAYAKVIGRMPENVYGRETIVVVAPSVAKLLGVKDEKFFVKIKY